MKTIFVFLLFLVCVFCPSARADDPSFQPSKAIGVGLGSAIVQPLTSMTATPSFTAGVSHLQHFEDPKRKLFIESQSILSAGGYMPLITFGGEFFAGRASSMEDCGWVYGLSMNVEGSAGAKGDSLPDRSNTHEDMASFRWIPAVRGGGICWLGTDKDGKESYILFTAVIAAPLAEGDLGRQKTLAMGANATLATPTVLVSATALPTLDHKLDARIMFAGYLPTEQGNLYIGVQGSLIAPMESSSPEFERSVGQFQGVVGIRW